MGACYLYKSVCSWVCQLSDRNNRVASGLLLACFSWGSGFPFLTVFRSWLYLSTTVAWCSEGLEFVRNALELFSLKALLLSVEQISTFEGKKIKLCWTSSELLSGEPLACPSQHWKQFKDRNASALAPSLFSAARSNKQLRFEGSSGPAWAPRRTPPSRGCVTATGCLLKGN